MKRNKLTILLLILSVFINIYFFISLYRNNSANKMKVKENSEVGYKFNAVISSFHTDASITNREGYFTRLNDTIIIQPFLKVDFVYRNLINHYPLISLYELSETHSNFKLIDTIRYHGDNSFNFINKDSCTKLLLYRIDLPVGDSVQKFHGAFRLRTEMKDHQMSYPINESILDSAFNEFLKY